ncbi:aspartate/glutamate racemase family protein [Cohaesibacter sp. ES.047]|uniref:aspartate/glutamate racemase family protein n=1 Tax=Cohaesibacter sp. ES.047 TaxID=1798205 RepID=UPI000BB8FFD2|nr:aspartate/glutamate racemase family protein [Cohaesibacter sp. ES.047]
MPDPSPSPFVGILMLDTRFERPIGDAGNVASYPCPARVAVVEGAESPEIVKDGRPSDALVEAFLRAARQLEADGAIAITSTCGFLITIRKELQAAVSIPVITSALCLYPALKARHPDGRIGILTASKSSLGKVALAAAGIDAKDVVIEGMEDCPAFAEAILRAKADQTLKMDQGAIEAAITAKAKAMVARHPNVRAFLLECGNMPPYQAAIAKATGRPVVSLLDGIADLLRRA